MSGRGLCLWHSITCHPGWHADSDPDEMYVPDMTMPLGGEGDGTTGRYDGDFYVSALNLMNNNLYGFFQFFLHCHGPMYDHYDPCSRSAESTSLFGRRLADADKGGVGNSRVGNTIKIYIYAMRHLTPASFALAAVLDNNNVASAFQNPHPHVVGGPSRIDRRD
jgi:hypothetical protein